MLTINWKPNINYCETNFCGLGVVGEWILIEVCTKVFDWNCGDYGFSRQLIIKGKTLCRRSQRTWKASRVNLEDKGEHVMLLVTVADYETIFIRFYFYVKLDFGWSRAKILHSGGVGTLWNTEKYFQCWIKSTNMKSLQKLHTIHWRMAKTYIGSSFIILTLKLQNFKRFCEISIGT